MIFEEATKEAYGYYASELKPKSHKPIIAACDKCDKVRETSKNLYRSLCNSCAQKGQNNPMFNKHHSEETRALISAARKGIIFTEEHKANISAARKGKKHTEETKAKLSAAGKGKIGDKASNWKGGISFEPYCVKFNEEFKEYIRAKFGVKCFLCPTTQEENGKKLSVHHVNYNKDCGCDGDETCNFVPLCKKCHSKTNGNRDYWQKIITDKLHCLIIGWDI